MDHFERQARRLLDLNNDKSGDAWIRAIVQGVLEATQSDSLSESSDSGPTGYDPSLVSAIQLITTLCWLARVDHKTAISQFHTDGDSETPLSEKYLLNGDDPRSIYCTAHIYVASARYEFDFRSVADGLDALARALPSGVDHSDDVVFRTIKLASDVALGCGLSDAARPLAGSAVSAAAKTTDLPSVATLREGFERVIAVDFGGGPAYLAGWLLHAMALLPLPQSQKGKEIVDIVDYFRLMDEMAGRVIVTGTKPGGTSRMPITHFRQSRALYALGKIAAAKESAMRAIVEVEPNRPEVVDEFVAHLRLLEQEESFLERTYEARDLAIAEAQSSIERLLDNASNRLSSDIETRAEELREETRHHSATVLYRSVEILGLFIAILAVIATTTGTAVLGNLSQNNRIWLVVLGVGASLAFMFLLRAIVGSGVAKDPAWRRRRRIDGASDSSN